MKVEQTNKTYELRKVIKSLLDTVEGNSYPDNAPDNAIFPYKVYSLDNVQLGDEADRNDYILLIDIWDYSNNSRVVENIADELEKVFNRANKPQETILPTFYLYLRRNLKEDDKKIKHIQLEIQIQSYSTESEN